MGYLLILLREIHVGFIPKWDSHFYWVLLFLWLLSYILLAIQNQVLLLFSVGLGFYLKFNSLKKNTSKPLEKKQLWNVLMDYCKPGRGKMNLRKWENIKTNWNLHSYNNITSLPGCWITRMPDVQLECQVFATFWKSSRKDIFAIYFTGLSCTTAKLDTDQHFNSLQYFQYNIETLQCIRSKNTEPLKARGLSIRWGDSNKPRSGFQPCLK